MLVSDIHLGEATIVEVRPASAEDFGVSLRPLTEVQILSSQQADSCLLKVEDQAWEIEGCSDRQQLVLDRLVKKNLPKLAWVNSCEPKTQNATRSIILEIREFPAEHVWPGEIDLAVDENIVEAMRSKRKSLVSIDVAIAWLTEIFLIKVGGEESLILISGTPVPHAERQSSFRMFGKGWAADVAPNESGRLRINRIVEARKPITDDERRPIFIVRGQLRFADITIAGNFRGAAKTLLDQLVEDASSYLGLWKEYNLIEQQSLLRRAREFGWLKYLSRQPRADGTWRFLLSGDNDLSGRLQFLDENEQLDLEAAATIPSELAEHGDVCLEGERPRGRRVFAGSFAGFDLKAKTIDLKLPLDRHSDDNPPPEKGVIFISLSGDRMRLERRMKAQAKIASASCPMPQLGLLIEGKAVPERRRSQRQALSASARKAFGGAPTERQVEALRVALNTPDIVLIQGPPGTGKTRVISALQTLLSEIYGDSDQIAGRSLLTSYQHDAVENVASATQVYGLPAIKIGRRRGTDNEADGFERWRMDRVEHVSAQLAGARQTPAGEALRRCRDLAAGHIMSPNRNENVTKLLDETRILAGPHIPASLQDALLALRQRIQRPNAYGALSDEIDLALKAARGLRTDAATFSDDGPAQAFKAIRRLKPLDILNDEELALLQRVAEWETDDLPDFLHLLGPLKASLIDRLLPDERPANAPARNTDVEGMLLAVVDALKKRIQSSQGGEDSVLYQYRDDLEHDQRGVREAVQRYTFALAATCQQAVGFEMNRHKGEDGIFETVVVDEAARANPLDLFIPMSLAEQRIVLVGDHRQLPHILDHEIEQDLEKSVSEKTSEMLRTSLFKRLFEQLREREKHDGVKRTVTLDVQYRMHPLLGQFVSDTFYAPYGEGFRSARDASEFTHNLVPYGDAVAAWVSIPFKKGKESGGQSKRRRAEAVWIVREVRRLLETRPDFSVGVISFYSAQVTEILEQMTGVGLSELADDGTYRLAESWRETRDGHGRLKERLRVGTVDAFQGKEFDVVFLSMTRSNEFAADDIKSCRRKFGHLVLENRMCVATSRQQRLLICVGDEGMLSAPEAREAVPSLIKFHELCGGPHGIILHP